MKCKEKLGAALSTTLITLTLTMMAPAAQAAVKAFQLCTGPDNNSHVVEGTIDPTARTDVNALHFKETAAHSSFDWHQDPEPQYVITLSGTLEFVTKTGETFTLHPGDVLLAQDNSGSGHRWRLIDDQPWKRAYVVLKPGAKTSFVPKPGGPKGC